MSTKTKDRPRTSGARASGQAKTNGHKPAGDEFPTATDFEAREQDGSNGIPSTLTPAQKDELGFLNREYGAKLDAMRAEDLFELVHSAIPAGVADRIVNRIMHANATPNGQAAWTSGRGALAYARLELLRKFSAGIEPVVRKGKADGKLSQRAVKEKPAETPAVVQNGGEPSEVYHPESDAGELVQLIPIGMVSPSRMNPRKHFDQAYIEELGASLRANGQLQPCTVRPLPGAHSDSGKVELILGECRWRAAKWAGLHVLKCIVRNPTDKSALAWMLDENMKRRDISAIEEARALKLMIDKFGYTQEQLAATFRGSDEAGDKPKGKKAKSAGPTSQGQISNRLRLLELPDKWQQKVIEGKLPPSHARILVPWVKYPKALDQLFKSLERDDWQIGSVGDFEENHVEDAIISVCKSIWSGEEKLAKEHAEEIQLIELGPYSLWAYNAAAWKRIKSADEKTNQKSRDGKEEKASAKSKSAEKKLSPAEVKQRARAQQLKFNKRLGFWYDTWLQEQIAVRVEDGSASQAFVEKLLLFFATRDTRGQHSVQVDELIAGKKPRDWWRRSGFKTYVCKDADVLGIVRKTCAAWMRADRNKTSLTLCTSEDLRAIANELAIDPAKHWVLTEDFLKLHNKQQLVDLALEWRYVTKGDAEQLFANRKHSQTVAELLACAKERKPKPSDDLLAVAKKGATDR